jgi:hypothetical protein
MKKPIMAEEAERLMIDSRWLPHILRTKSAARAENSVAEGENAKAPGSDALAAE